MSSPLLFATACAMVLLAIACIRRIPEGQVYTLRTRGGRLRALGAGVHVVVPLFERVAHRIDLGGSALPVDALDDDGADGVVYFQVVDPRRADGVIDRLEGVIREAARRHGAAARGEGPGSRAHRLKAALNEELREHGVLVARVEVARSR